MRVTAKGIGKKAVKVVDGIVNWAVLITILLLVALSGYAMWDSNLVYTEADAKQYEVYKPSAENTVSFDELRDINPEVFSWLTVYGTNIDYPVTQGDNNMKYVNMNAFGEYSLSGAIFLDSDNSKEYTDFNSILYGHHMEKQAMFGELDRFSDKSFFESNPYGNLFYNGKDHGLAFFAFVHTDAYDGATFTPNIQGVEEQQKYLDMLLEKAMYKRDIGVTVEDRIVLLTTCSSDTTNGRDILVARITSDVYGDALKNDNTDYEKAEVDAQQGIWKMIPCWLKITVPIVLLVLIIIAIYVYWRRKKEKT